MKTINKPGDNLGGGLKLYAIPPAMVSSLSAGIMTISSTTDVIEVYFTPGTLNFDQEHVPAGKDRSGGYHALKITAFTPKLSNDAEIILEQMRNRSYVVVFMDGNEQLWACGTALQPMRFAYTSSTRNDTSGLNGYSLSFERRTTSAPMLISDPFTE